jgi:serine protease AprX
MNKPRRKPTKRNKPLTKSNKPKVTESSHAPELPASDPKSKPFVPKQLDRTVIAIPLLDIMEEEIVKLNENPKLQPKSHKVIIDLNLQFPGGRDEARQWVIKTTRELIKERGVNKDSRHQDINEERSTLNPQYLFARLEGRVIRQLVRRDALDHPIPKSGSSGLSRLAIYHIWPDFRVKALTNKSISTVKADAARASFSAFGSGIVWAVMDSGIDASHPHFKVHENLKLDSPLKPRDFTGGSNTTTDPMGHGTHVAGIIGGEMDATGKKGGKGGLRAYVRNRDEHGKIKYIPSNIDRISGMAPKCKLLNFRVLDDQGEGDVSSLLEAIAQIQEINGYGRRLLIHGVNMSLGNDFEPEWFACGQSPLCVEVNRLVSSGVVVVVAAGNSGYESLKTENSDVISAGMALTINDPGNAENAITVGSTHRDMPHVYGVSYFSSKGPTGDGRAKPDIVAPGEKIVSCSAGEARDRVKEDVGKDSDYVEDSGTSMAAPHVSGVIAAFLSVRREFIGQPEKVKEIFLSTATDLKREKYFQGYGLVDLMRAIQSV